ncbi:hypothetical protein FBUS_00606 [Fasciolopsis buskii]|uniref:Uncharacterized protein n=1 Tax=Fasciolopsis buskii TaxID=27845 RepID=A0A8E0RMC4_9TREM|nr:hypothetical protein FBUS_00606 [Fasciolopsis buski]
MDVQYLWKLLNIEKLEQWHILYATGSTVALAVVTYVCYHFLCNKPASKSKKSKSHKKRGDEKKTTTVSPVPVVNSTKNTATTSGSLSKHTKTTPKKQASVTTGSVMKSEVTDVKPIPLENVTKVYQPESRTESSSSDVDEGQWIEVGKTKKDKKNVPTNHTETVSIRDTIAASPKDMSSGKKNGTIAKKGKQPSGAGIVKPGGISHPGYKPIEEPDFSKPPKANRRSYKGEEEEEEEWQEVRFSRRGRKFASKE